MPLLEAPVPRQPNAADGAQRIKQVLFQTVTQMDHSLRQVRQIIERHGRSEIVVALGDEANELQDVYRKIKATLKELDNSRDVPDLPG